MRAALPGGVFILALLLPPGSVAAVTGDPAAGADDFRFCAACHSLEPGKHRTGPSLAGILGRRSGTAEGFHRYSPALKAAGVVWDEAALDAWIADSQAFILGNGMKFRGMPDPQGRADLIAYLAQAEQGGAPMPQGGMMNMGAQETPDLKTLDPEHQVTAIRHCEDTYEITTADGTTEPFWEMNLRFKTDGSKSGPEPNKPMIVAAGMIGDRASVVFSSPQEISPAIRQAC
jgi:cytochrome c